MQSAELPLLTTEGYRRQIAFGSPDYQSAFDDEYYLDEWPQISREPYDALRQQQVASERARASDQSTARTVDLVAATAATHELVFGELNDYFRDNQSGANMAPSSGGNVKPVPDGLTLSPHGTAVLTKVPERLGNDREASYMSGVGQLTREIRAKVSQENGPNLVARKPLICARIALAGMGLLASFVGAEAYTYQVNNQVHDEAQSPYSSPSDATGLFPVSTPASKPTASYSRSAASIPTSLLPGNVILVDNKHTKAPAKTPAPTTPSHSSPTSAPSKSPTPTSAPSETTPGSPSTSSPSKTPTTPAPSTSETLPPTTPQPTASTSS